MVSTTGKVISPSHLAHVVLRTAAGEQFQKMNEFYKTFLGGTSSYENERLSFITYDEEHHRVALIGIPGLGKRDAGNVGLAHIAFTFDTLPDLLKAYHQRLELGIKPVWCVNHGPTISMYYADPDGNHVETQVDTFKTAEEATAFMKTEEFTQNPFGVNFVPEEIEERLRNGESEESIYKRENIGVRTFETVPMI